MLHRVIITLAFILLFQAISFAQEDLGQVMVNADQMPYWKSCGTSSDALGCTEKELIIYIQQHLKYPPIAKVNDIEGTVIISCIISRSGKLVNPNVISDIGSGCGTEALRVVENMPLWLPARHEGKAVSVVYNIEIPFKITTEKVAQPNDIIYEEPIKPMLESKDSIPDNSDPFGAHEEKQLLPSDYEETDIGRVYTRTSQMPYFSGCEKMKEKSKNKRTCSNNRLVEYLSAYVTYPDEAKAKSIEGIVFISFIIDEYGNVIKPELSRDIGGGCGEEALRVVSAMPKWEPGKERDRPVKVKMNLPLRFYMSSGAAGKYKIHWGAIRGNEITEVELLDALTDDLLVRNIYGDDITISSLEVIYEKGAKIKEERSNGDISLDIQRFLRKAKAGGKIIFIATIQEKGELVDVSKVFKVVK